MIKQILFVLLLSNLYLEANAQSANAPTMGQDIVNQAVAKIQTQIKEGYLPPPNVKAPTNDAANAANSIATPTTNNPWIKPNPWATTTDMASRNTGNNGTASTLNPNQVLENTNIFIPDYNNVNNANTATIYK